MENLKRFSNTKFKRVAQVVMGEPSDEYKHKVHQRLLEEKQAKAENDWRRKKLEKQRKRELEERQKQLAEAARKRAEEIEKQRLAEQKKADEGEKPKDDAKEGESEA